MTYTLHINYFTNDGDISHTDTHQVDNLLQAMDNYGCINLCGEQTIEIEHTDQCEAMLADLGITPTEGFGYYVVATPNLRIVEEKQETYCAAEWDKDTNTFVPSELFISMEQMVDELGAYRDDDVSPNEHNEQETARDISDRVVWCNIDDLRIETGRQLIHRGNLTQVYDQQDGGCETFIANWFDRQHFEDYIGKRFDSEADYADWLEDFQRDNGGHIASMVSTLVKELTSQHYAEYEEE